LANNFGNLFSRVLAMTAKYFDGAVPAVVDDKIVSDVVRDAWEKYDEYFACFDLKKACEEACKLASFANLYVDENKPWVLAKNDKEKLARVIYVLLELLRHIAMMLWPFIPETSDKMLLSLGQCKDAEHSLHNNISCFALAKLLNAGVYRAHKFGELKEGSKVASAGPLFPRREVV
jgi:methionyl-tRNA synthetase